VMQRLRPALASSLAVLAAACGGGLAPLPIPPAAGLAPSSIAAATGWADSARPVEHPDIGSHWKVQD